MHRYRIVNTPSTILDQVGTSRNRLFGVRAYFVPLMLFYSILLAPVSQQRGPWDSLRQNPGENTALILFCGQTKAFEEFNIVFSTCECLACFDPTKAAKFLKKFQVHSVL